MAEPSTLAHEVSDLRCPIEDLARRVHAEAPAEAHAIAAMLRGAALLFDRIGDAESERAQ